MNEDHGAALLALMDDYSASPYAVLEEEEAAEWRGHAEALIAEAARLRADAVHWQDEAALLRIERDRARAWIEKCRHPECAPGRACDCGLDAALADEPREG